MKSISNSRESFFLLLNKLFCSVLIRFEQTSLATSTYDSTIGKRYTRLLVPLQYNHFTWLDVLESVGLITRGRLA